MFLIISLMVTFLNVSGGYGLFKKQPVIKIREGDSNSVGEDMDLAIRLHRYFAKNRIKIQYKIRCRCSLLDLVYLL